MKSWGLMRLRRKIFRVARSHTWSLEVIASDHVLYRDLCKTMQKILPLSDIEKKQPGFPVPNGMARLAWRKQVSKSASPAEIGYPEFLFD
jgi:hypothetical protein